MGCIYSKASVSIREELRLRHSFQSRSAASAWEELLTSSRSNARTSRDGKRSLSFHTVEEYDALIRAQHSFDVKMQESRCDVAVEMGSKRKAVARGLKTLELEFPANATLIYSPGTYVTPKFGGYNAPVPQNAVFSPDLIAAFEDCMQHLQLEEDTILEHMFHHDYSLATSSNIYNPIDL
ncbi:uncharacterized protein LOC130985970 [Salvia miltiorrhiza]|uniref:uncharacterized protein LOC130985970 n=1 Tax=Salvia miltiorrhiza TaxID=226208 RepID=UPI0025AD98F4|nr:uncharacterized protein LOC130985970 [Salvia miltiorrhiza]